MIIDSHDGMVATVRMTNDEAAVLKALVEMVTCVSQRTVFQHFPNVSLNHLETTLRKVSRGKS